MTHRFRTIRLAVPLLAMLASVFVCATPASAQLNSIEQTATLTAVLPESLTVVLLPAATTFVLTSGGSSNPAVLPIVATTTWTFALTRTSLALYGYFSSANVALAHTLPSTTVDIPASHVEVSVNGGATMAFDQSVAFGAAAAGRQLFAVAINALNASGVRADTLQLNVNLTGLVLPADAYIGTLRVRAQVTP